MKPVLFEIFGYPVPAHPIFYIVGFLAAFVWGYYRGRRVGLDPEDVLDVGFWIVIGVLVGSRLMFILVTPGPYLADPLRVFYLWEGGMALYGGAAGLIIATLLAIKIKKMPVGDTGDVIAESAALGLVIGRLGCLFAGCCYGRPTDLSWCITFTAKHSVAYQLVGERCLHPTQIYSFLWLGICFALVVLISRRKSFPGQPTWSFFIIYPVGRFIIELFRGDPRGYIQEPYLSSLFSPLLSKMTYTHFPEGGFHHAAYLSSSQILSIISIIVAGAGYIIVRRAHLRSKANRDIS